MENKYIKPELEVVLFTKNDVFTTEGETSDPQEAYDDDEGKILMTLDQ